MRQHVVELPFSHEAVTEFVHSTALRLTVMYPSALVI